MPAKPNFWNPSVYECDNEKILTQVGCLKDQSCMNTEKNEHWQRLCDLAKKEQDPKRLAELVDELNRMLDDEEYPSEGVA